MREGRRARRRRRRGLGGRSGRAAFLLALGGIAMLGVFVVSRVLTDRFAWSQWVWWVPVLWWMIPIWGLWGASGLLGRWSVKRGGRYGKRPAVRRVLLLGCLSMTLFVVFGVWHLHRAAGAGVGLDGPRSEAHRNGSIRVMHWNIGAAEVDTGSMVGLVDRLDADIVLIANARLDGQHETLRQQLVGVVGIDPSADENWRGSATFGRAIVVSRYPVKGRMRYLGLGSDTAKEGLRSTGGFGWFSMLTVQRGPDAGDGGEGEGEGEGEGDLVIWFVDLPSEPTAQRKDSIAHLVTMAREVSSSSRTDGTVGEAGRAGQTADKGALDRPGLIIGDFNTPRGSESLEQLDVFEGGSGFVDAFARCGSGRARSWTPDKLNGLERLGVALADWHIDLSLVGNGWEPSTYELLGEDFGGEHRVQVVDIER